MSYRKKMRFIFMADIDDDFHGKEKSDKNMTECRVREV